jgi:hypothetical protein
VRFTATIVSCAAHGALIDSRLSGTVHRSRSFDDDVQEHSRRPGCGGRGRAGQPAELIAQNIPSAASMCYDEGANQLVIPMNANNGLAFVPLR